MRKIALILTLSVFSGLSAQEAPKKMKHCDKKHTECNKKYLKNVEGLSKLSFGQKQEYFQKIQIEDILKVLELPEEKQEMTKKLLQEYFSNKSEILKKSKSEHKKAKLTDEKAKKKLKQNLEVAQQILDNKKLYTDKFLKILTPQQVLKIHKMENNMFYQFKLKYHEKKEK